MAQFSTDFSEYTLGAIPSDWTQRIDSNCTYDVTGVSGSSFGDQALSGLVGATLGYCALTWNDLGTPADVDLTVRCRTYYNAYICVGLSARVSGTNGYLLGIGYAAGVPTLYVYKIASGSASTLASYELKLDGPDWWTDDQWAWLRFQLSGTTLKGKIWKDGDPEPAAWQITVTDSSYASGAAGVYARNYTSVEEWDWFGAGTAGDAPPAPTSEAVARVTQAVAEVLQVGVPVARVTQVTVEVLRENMPKVVASKPVIIVAG